jgi:hypothetical protein
MLSILLYDIMRVYQKVLWPFLTCGCFLCKILLFVVPIDLFYCAENLKFFPSEDVIYGDYVYKTWDEELIKRVLGFFVPENMRVDVVSKLIQKSEGELFSLPCLICNYIYVFRICDRNLLCH